jgi:RNA polymerase sigma-70 factor (ECF subfamily)
MQPEDRRQVFEQLVRLADGDRSAFAPVYEVLWPLAHRVCMRALKDSPDAEDAAQSALLKMFTRAAEFDKERDAVSWALGIIAYECKTFRQRERRRREEPLSAGAEPVAPNSPFEQALNNELQEAAKEILGTLRKSDIEVIEQMMNDERPDIPRATFRKRVERAVARLRAAWGTRYGNG